MCYNSHVTRRGGDKDQPVKKSSIDIQGPVVLAIVLAITFVAFLPCLNNGFVNWDDPEYVVYNPLIRSLSPSNIVQMFTTHLTGKYNPLVLLSFAFEFQAVKLHPFLYHFTNLILHLFNVALVFALVRRLWNNLSLALLTALLFGIHPMQVEAVAWITGRKDVLFAFFYLSALLAYLSYLKTDKKVHKPFYLTAVFFLLSLFSKLMAMTLPLILLLLDRQARGRISKDDLIEKIPFCFFAAAFMIPTWMAAHSVNAFPGTELYGFFDRILLSVYALWVYLVKLIVPFRLSAFHSHPSTYVELFFALTVMAAFGIGIYQLNKNDKFFTFCMLFFLLTIWPVLHLLEINDSIIYERFLYLPSVGIFLLLARIFVALTEDEVAITTTSQRLLLFFCGVYILTFAFITFNRCKVWNDSETLWTDVLKKYPETAVAHNNLGNFYVGDGEADKALMHFNLAIALAPRYTDAYYNKGNMMAKKDNFEEAIVMYSKTIELDPFYIGAYNNRGNMYLLSGQYDKALKDYNTLVEMNPMAVSSYLNRGTCRAMIGNYRGALEDFEKVLQLNPSNELALRRRRELEQRLATMDPSAVPAPSTSDQPM